MKIEDIQSLNKRHNDIFCHLNNNALIYYTFFSIILKSIVIFSFVFYAIPLKYISFISIFIIAFISFSLLLKFTLRKAWLLIVNLAFTLLFIFQAIYFNLFGTIPSFYTLSQIELHDIYNMISMIKPEYIYYFIDIILFSISLFFTHKLSQDKINLKVFIVTFSISIFSIFLIAIMPLRELKVHYIDIGHGDCIFIDYGDVDILIDGGYRYMGPTVVKYLKDHNVDNIDIMISTHPHGDHIGGLIDVLDNFDVKLVVDSGIAFDSDEYRDYWNRVSKNVQIKNTKYMKDKNIAFELGRNVNLSIIESGDNYSNVNDASVVAKLTYNKKRFLFTGDIGYKAENNILGKDIECDVLKVPHHGADTSSSVDFLKKVNPQYSIITVGKKNPYGYPSKETLDRLKSYKIEVYRIDENSDVVVTTDGKNIAFNK